MITLLSNNSCSKSNCALAYVRSFQELNVHIRQYMEDPLSRAELTALLQRSQRPVRDLVRTTDKAFIEQFGVQDDLSDDELTELLVQRPELLQRPILIDDDVIIIGRPPELIMAYLHSKKPDVKDNTGPV